MEGFIIIGIILIIFISCLIYLYRAFARRCDKMKEYIRSLERQGNSYIIEYDDSVRVIISSIHMPLNSDNVEYLLTDCDGTRRNCLNFYLFYINFARKILKNLD